MRKNPSNVQSSIGTHPFKNKRKVGPRTNVNCISETKSLESNDPVRPVSTASNCHPKKPEQRIDHPQANPIIAPLALLFVWLFSIKYFQQK
jgi:hypothetical protein